MMPVEAHVSQIVCPLEVLTTNGPDTLLLSTMDELLNSLGFIDVYFCVPDSG